MLRCKALSEAENATEILGCWRYQEHGMGLPRKGTDNGWEHSKRDHVTCNWQGHKRETSQVPQCSYHTTRFLDLKMQNLVFYLLGLGLDLIPPILSILPFFPSTISMLMVYSLLLYLGSQHLFYFLILQRFTYKSLPCISEAIELVISVESK